MPYNRTIWENNKTPLNADNLNNIEEGIEEATEAAASANDSASNALTKANQALQHSQNVSSELETLRAKVNSMEGNTNTEGGTSLNSTFLKDVTYNKQTGVFIFTKHDGTIFEVDLAIEKVVTNFSYNAETTSLELTLADNSIQSIPLSDFIKAYEGEENEFIQVLVQNGNKIQAVLKDNSITLDKLHPDVKQILQNATEDINDIKNSLKNIDSLLDNINGEVV